MCLEAFVRALLVRAHQARVARHIGGQDRSKTANSGHYSTGPSPRAWRSTQSPMVMVMTMFAVAALDRDNRVIVAVVEVFGGRRLVVVPVVISDAYETAGFCRVADAAVARQCRIGADGA